ncbi:MAG: SiaC family regulatory phosphoprotein [Crocinitomicaceae bacterium]|nr:SiaC family regulatory phosphoprotein [Crocinitomicaceae bacterium]
MKDLFITASATSPLVHFKNNGDIQISGKIILDQNSEFWTQISQWVEAYKSNKPSKTILNLQIDYLNSASLKELNRFLILIASISSSESDLYIGWHYNETDVYMREIGFELSKQSGFNFQMNVIKEFV